MPTPGFTGVEELYPAHLQGWRYWKYDRERLLSVGISSVTSINTPWVPGVAKKAIHWPDLGHKPHETPLMSCVCGYWSYKDPEDLFKHVRQNLTHPTVIHFGGRINLWGRVVVGTIGYRSEYAYPETLLVPEILGMPHETIALKLQEIYKVELHTVSADMLWGRTAFDVAGLPPRGASPS